MNDQQFYTLCPKCGKKIRQGAKFCPQCAESFMEQEPPKRVCPNCGRVAAGEKFCSECGTAMRVQKDMTEKT